MENSLTSEQSRLLAAIGKFKYIKDFYLAGGTALNIQLCHRLSVDFDFFSERPLNSNKIIEESSHDAPVKVIGMEKGTLHLKIGEIPVSFFEYHYKVLEKKQFHGILIASLKDIGLMKIMAIQQRGLRKDFIDLYAICMTGITLPALLELMKEKYLGIKFDIISIMKSLCYFEDAIDDVPLLTKDIEWETVKKYFKKEVRALY